MTVFFTADTHFGHAGVIGMCDRPFASVEEMDDALVYAWNAVVRPDDVVWHLGDFQHRCKPKRTAELFSRLRGRKSLVVGNHDRPHVRSLPWEAVVETAQIAVDGQRLFLSHLAHRTWYGIHRGVIHLYGHSHGRLPGTTRSCDVGVDAVGWCPVTLPRIREILAENASSPDELLEASKGHRADEDAHTI